MPSRPALPLGPVLVVGLARSGVSAARALASRAPRVLACDSGPADPLPGVDVRQASYGDAEASRQALEGVDVLLMVSAAEAEDRRDQHLAFVRAARTLGVGLDEVREALDRLPEGRTPTRADWTRLSRTWRARLDEQIDALTALRDGLDSCIGCGCLSLARCRLSNPDDRMSEAGPGARMLPPMLRRTPAQGV